MLSITLSFPNYELFDEIGKAYENSKGHGSY